MSKRANPAMIGVFVVGAVLLVVVAIVLFGSQKYFTASHTVIAYFEESVNGLDEGAPVKFKGVDVGQVKDILIQFEKDGDSAYVPVLIEIQSPEMPGENGSGLRLYDEKEYERLIKNGLRASLDYQSYLTGKLYIELDYHPEDIVPMFVDKEGPYREIPTVGSELDEIWSQASDVLSQMSKIDFEGISRDIASIANTLGKGLGDVEFKKLNDQFIAAMDSLKDLSDRAGGHVDPLVSDLRAAIADARETFTAVESAAVSIGNAAESIEGVVAEDSPLGGQFKDTLEELEGAGRSVNKLASFLERNPNALLGGRK